MLSKIPTDPLRSRSPYRTNELEREMSTLSDQCFDAHTVSVHSRGVTVLQYFFQK